VTVPARARPVDSAVCVERTATVLWAWPPERVTQENASVPVTEPVAQPSDPDPAPVTVPPATAPETHEAIVPLTVAVVGFGTSPNPGLNAIAPRCGQLASSSVAASETCANIAETASALPARTHIPSRRTGRFGIGLLSRQNRDKPPDPRTWPPTSPQGVDDELHGVSSMTAMSQCRRSSLVGVLGSLMIVAIAPADIYTVAFATNPLMYVGCLRPSGITQARRRRASSVRGDATMHLMPLADWFAERSARGMILRAVGAWLFVGLPVIGARLWWSPAGAIAVFVIAVTVYVVAARRYIQQQGRQP
jgi:hypothetical protein